KIRDLERSASVNPRFSNGFNADRKASICVNCPYMSDRDMKSFTVLSGTTASFSETQGLSNVKDCWMIFNKEAELKECPNCTKRLQLKEYYRARIPYESKAQIEEVLRTAYRDLQLEGVSLGSELYIMKKVVKMNGKDVLLLDTIVPVDE
ncbi:MAG: hypothetical protein IJF79_05355, partial [Clostridia bacterium]|nr:hypothetical protein [Clostridia bacterium]